MLSLLFFNMLGLFFLLLILIFCSVMYAPISMSKSVLGNVGSGTCYG